MKIHVEMLPQLCALPVYALMVAAVALQCRKQIQLERRLFHTRVHSLVKQASLGVLWGWAAGLIASLVMAFVGLQLPWRVAAMLWIFSAALALFRVRFLCLAYAAGLVGVLKFVVQTVPEQPHAPVLTDIVQALAQTNMAALFILVGVLHLIEAVWIRLAGARSAVPLFLEGKRGKAVGGYQIAGFWPVPVMLIGFPAADGSIWSAWMHGHFFWQGSWSFFILPAVIGFMDMAVTELPARKAVRSSRWLIAYGIVLIALALAADWMPDLLLLASLAAVLLHEAIIWYGKRRETQGGPLFIHDTRGLRILAVLPDSPAARMNIEAGETIHKVNGRPVLTKEQLHSALQVNSAFCKMEIINLQGHSKFVSRALFEGEHHQLGILLAPDGDAELVAGARGASWTRYLKLKKFGRGDGASSRM